MLSEEKTSPANLRGLYQGFSLPVRAPDYVSAPTSTIIGDCDYLLSNPLDTG